MKHTSTPPSYTLDRFEDNGWAVLENEAGQTFNIPRFWLPDACAEGDVIIVERQPMISEDEADYPIAYKGLDIYVDEQARLKREEAMQAKREKLKKAKKGTISL